MYMLIWDRMLGSSPRMRGTLLSMAASCLLQGIIPADAGNTKVVNVCMVFDWDHPRGCGEHKCQRMALRDGWGSSPRMRGTRIVDEAWCFEIGIIPADAGNTR